MSRLIVCEKENTARRIATILSDGKYKVEYSYKVPVYVFSKDSNEEFRILGLKGHVLKVDFPLQYSNWQKVEPVKLIDAEIVKVPIKKGVINALKKEAKKAENVIIAMDFDREGELIGVDALNLIRETNPRISARRARFSALTESEIKQAFSNLDDLYLNLAQSGEARQDIDLIWGATLTRFLSLATSRLGRQFLSVGRVQSPTLCLIAQREVERRAFKSKPYWELQAKFEYDGEEFIADHKNDKFWEEKGAKKAISRLENVGVVVKVERNKKKSLPPAPFNTTSFLSAAASLGVSPARAMRIAEGLYMEGFISYPRVDNTVYPSSLDLKGILSLFEKNPELSSDVQELLGKKKLTPTRGEKLSTDHPPIYPTGTAKKEDLRPEQWKIYELVVRRFFGTLADPAIIETVRIDLNCGEEPFYVRGRTVLKEGWLKFYPYGRKKDEEVPPLNEGDEFRLIEPILKKKETQPPARYSQAQLLRKMESLSLGTKSTRHVIIQNLYDREYIHGNPVEPTELGLAMAAALNEYAQKISTPEMTAELEKEMDAIAEGRAKREKVVNQSRTMLGGVMLSLNNSKGKVADVIREGIREGKVMGECPQCGSKLKIIRAKKSKKRFVGCTGYPQCKTAYPLPQRGEIFALGESCEECGTPKVKVISGKGRPWILCLDPGCPTKQDKQK